MVGSLRGRVFGAITGIGIAMIVLILVKRHSPFFSGERELPRLNEKAARDGVFRNF